MKFRKNGQWNNRAQRGILVSKYIWTFQLYLTNLITIFDLGRGAKGQPKETKGKPKENHENTTWGTTGKPTEHQSETKERQKGNQRETKGTPKENQRETKGKSKGKQQGDKRNAKGKPRGN